MKSRLAVWTGAALAVLGAWSPIAMAAAQQASMELTGNIKVGADGKALDYSIDHQSQVQPAVLKLVAATIAQWRFAPRVAQAPMSLRIVANEREDGQFDMKVGAVSFGGKERLHGLAYKDKSRRVTYPDDLLHARVGGQVLVLVEVGRQGEVLHADAERIDLSRSATRMQMHRWRQSLARASVDAIRNWTFVVPTQGEAALAPHWYAVVPLQFAINRPDGMPTVGGYAQWHIYYPGDKVVPDWYRSMPGQVIPDVVTAGTLASLQPALQLLTSPQGS